MRCSHSVWCSGKKVRLEEVHAHRHRETPAPLPRKGLQNDRRVEVALMVGGEHDRSGKRSQQIAAFNRKTEEDVRQRENPRGLADIPDHADERPAIPRGKRERWLQRSPPVSAACSVRRRRSPTVRAWLTAVSLNVTRA